jgi:hypothetical protein
MLLFDDRSEMGRQYPKPEFSIFSKYFPGIKKIQIVKNLDGPVKSLQVRHSRERGSPVFQYSSIISYPSIAVLILFPVSYYYQPVAN